MEEVTGGWRKFYDEELHNFYSSHIIRLTRTRMRWVGRVARIPGREEGFGGNLKERVKLK